jgi:hypothetical protein
MKFREHRGSLADSMATVVEVDGERGLLMHIMHLLERYYPARTYEDYQRVFHVTVKPYGYDERIKWDAHMVYLEGYGPIGFTDGPLPEKEEPKGFEARRMI